MTQATAPATPAELLARVQEAWWPFRIAVAAAGSEALARATPSGWTYKDLVAHVAAHEARTAQRLETLRTTEAMAFPGIQDADAFNADVVERTRPRAADDVLADLASSHERLVVEIRQLSDAQLHANDDWAATIVEKNTYGHYAEHEDELLAAVPKTREELVGLVERGWRRFRGAATGVGLTHLARPTSTGWSYKALLAHAARWLEAVVAELPVRLAGRRSDPPDIDAQNANAAAEGDRSSALEVLEQLDSAYRGALEALRGLPDGEVPFRAVRLVAAETYEHFRLHLPELRAARPRTVAQLSERLDEDWRFFREAVRHLGRAGLAERTSPGWTYKDLVAHAAAWLEEAPRRLREVREGRRDPIATTDDEIDRFNARAVESRRLVGPEAMLDELDTAYRQLVAAVRGLRDEEIAGSSHGSGALSIVAWCSYLHFDEHLAELGVAVP